MKVPELLLEKATLPVGVVGLVEVSNTLAVQLVAVLTRTEPGVQVKTVFVGWSVGETEVTVTATVVGLVVAPRGEPVTMTLYGPTTTDDATAIVKVLVAPDVDGVKDAGLNEEQEIPDGRGAVPLNMTEQLVTPAVLDKLHVLATSEPPVVPAVNVKVTMPVGALEAVVVSATVAVTDAVQLVAPNAMLQLTLPTLVDVVSLPVTVTVTVAAALVLPL